MSFRFLILFRNKYLNIYRITIFDLNNVKQEKAVKTSVKSQ